MSNVDLDKGGRIPQNVKTYLGPTTGWKYTDSPVDIEWSIEGGGGLVPIGIKPSIIIPDWLTISSWVILSPVTASAVFDIYKITLDEYLAGAVPTAADSICGSEKPTLSSAVADSASTLTGWTTQINQNDCLAINLESVVDATGITLILRCIRDIGQS